MLEIFLTITFMIVCCTCFQLTRYSREYEQDQERLSRYRRTQIRRRARRGHFSNNHRRNDFDVEERKKVIRDNVMLQVSVVILYLIYIRMYILLDFIFRI